MAAVICLLLIPLIAVAQRSLRLEQLNKKENDTTVIPVKIETVEEIPKVEKIEVIKPTETVSQPSKSDTNESLSQWLLKLRNCESQSHGLYKANTGNGYYGAYQFLISTWDRIAARSDVNRPDLVGVRPDLASPADQDFMIIQNTILSKGGLSSQNPGCYVKTGISNKPPV